MGGGSTESEGLLREGHRQKGREGVDGLTIGKDLFNDLLIQSSFSFTF